MKYNRILIILFLVVGLVDCSDELNNKYTNITARFSYYPVNAVPTLYRACTATGQFCSITTDGNFFYFDSPSSSDKIPRTAIQGYTGFVLGLGGLILGLPETAELGESSPRVTCYDLHCPNCYNSYNITKRMQIKEGGTAVCTSCNRTYNLNDQGIVAKGESGRSLFRYVVYFDGSTVSVNNN